MPAAVSDFDDDRDDAERDPHRAIRRATYGLLILTALGSLLGRIARVDSPDGVPFLSANDRSRWCTIRALVDEGTYVIDTITTERGWHTIDKVRHVGRDGKEHFYSSKPTLYPTLLAGEYWLISRITGATLAGNPYYTAKILLAVTNGFLLLVYFGAVICLVERWGGSDWSRIFVIAVAAWGTFLTTFGITLNNHLPAATSVAIATWCAMAIWYDQSRQPKHFVLAGFFAAFAAANELPALAFLAAIGLGLFLCDRRRTLVWFAPAAAIVVAGFFGTNIAAHDSWLPAYAHQDWYEFEGSGLTESTRKGVDRGEASKLKYAFHATLGHHGVLSLTPVWLLSIVGLLMLFGRQEKPTLGLTILGLTTICLVFYLGMQPIGNRNYGGVTSGFRWMFWFTPLWLLAMLPAADLAGRYRPLRWISMLLLFLSVASVSYSFANPWVHPWFYEYWLALGWN